MPGLPTQAAAGAMSAATLQTVQTLAAGLFPTQGNIYVVNPRYGSDNAPGTFQSPLQTLAAALDRATAGQNDIIYLCAASNTASLTTSYQTATLNWNKDLVHLIGVNDSPQIGQRSRVAFQAAYNTASNLFTLSANGCLI